MKGKTNFNNPELALLRALILKYENSNSKDEKKKLRTKMRKIGFYMSDYRIQNITINDFDRLFSRSKSKVISRRQTEKTEITNSKLNLNKFIKFDPLTDDQSKIPDEKGNYLILLKENSKLPETENEITYTLFNNKKVIYTGISNNSLKKRDYRQHFKGNAGSSTLRKSIGSMFGYKKIPRDRIDNGKTKFSEQDEKRLSEWMKKNLELHYFANNNPEQNEKILINKSHKTKLKL